MWLVSEIFLTFWPLIKFNWHLPEWAIQISCLLSSLAGKRKSLTSSDFKFRQPLYWQRLMIVVNIFKTWKLKKHTPKPHAHFTHSQLSLTHAHTHTLSLPLQKIYLFFQKHTRENRTKSTGDFHVNTTQTVRTFHAKHFPATLVQAMNALKFAKELLTKITIKLCALFTRNTFRRFWVKQ